MPPSVNRREEVVVEAGWMDRFCQISLRRSTLTCLMWSCDGGATTEWYQTLERTRDLAIRVRPRSDKDREKRESTREDILMIKESQRVSILSLDRGNKMPRVERGRVEGDGVLGGGLYVDGE